MTLAGLVAQAYPSPAWCTFFEVSNSTGSRVTRRADAVALGVWPSRGHAIIGFEFKSDRRDWLRELKAPEKAEAVAQHCDQWFVVATAPDIVKPVELPDPWGLYVANEARTQIRIAKACRPFPDRDPAIMRRSFVAAMLRKVSQTTVPKGEVARLVQEAQQTALAQTRDGHELQRLQDRIAQLEGILQTFKTATGVDLQHWHGPAAIAGAVQTVLDLSRDRRRLDDAARCLDLAARTMHEAIAAWPVVERPPT